MIRSGICPALMAGAGVFFQNRTESLSKSSRFAGKWPSSAWWQTRSQLDLLLKPAAVLVAALFPSSTTAFGDATTRGIRRILANEARQLSISILQSAHPPR
jgi:hypothetical protein